MSTPFERSLLITHRFAFAPLFQIAALPFGVHPSTCHVELQGTHFSAHYGPWTVSTPLANIASAEVTGPYSWFKVLGPPRLSLGDQSLTFASNPDRGVCIEFYEPVPGVEPSGRLRHPTMTVTVDDPEALVRDLLAATSEIDVLERDERALLENQTAAELRRLAQGLGLARVSSMKKAELIDRLLQHDELAESAIALELADGISAT